MCKWLKSIIVPIDKKGNISQPENVRGVALTGADSKIYTDILSRRLSKWTKTIEKNHRGSVGRL